MAEKETCGLLCFHPQCLQKAGSIGTFIFVFGLCNISSHAMLPYLMSQITSLERQFGFTSTQSGLLLAANDCGFLVFTLLMGYLARKVNIPKFLGFCNFITAIGAIICALPFFITRDSLHDESVRRLSDLPDVQTILMIKEAQQSSSGSLFEFPDFQPQDVFDSTLPSMSRSPGTLHGYRTTLDPLEYNNVTVSPAAGTFNESSRTYPVETSRPSTALPTTLSTKPASPFQTMLNKLEQFLGKETSNQLLSELGIGVGGEAPTFSDMKRLAKKLLANETLFNQLPPQAQQRVKMAARLFKRSAAVPESDPIVTDIASLHPYTLMMVIAPLCTSVPKIPVNCNMVAKIRNKGFTNDYTGVAFACLVVGMVLQGIGKSPRMAMGILYLDDNGNKTRTPLYMGILSAMLACSVFLAFAVGVLSSRLYVTLEEVNIHPFNPHWVGAWWLGFLIIAGLACLPVVFLCAFPRKLPSTAKQSECQQLSYVAPVPGTNRLSKGFFSSIKRCIKNPIYLGLTFSSTVIFFFVTSTTPFIPKYLESQFRLPSWKANIFAGLPITLSTLFGALVVGFTIARAKVTFPTILKLALGVAAVFTIAAGVGMLLGCDTVKIIGTDSQKISNTESASNITKCTTACHCGHVDYFPVCGSNGRSYFSACHAGCRSTDETVFTRCECIGGNGTASLGLCPPGECNMLPPYMITVAIQYFSVMVLALVSIFVGFRSVAERDRGIAIAFLLFISNIFGWLPGSIVFGRLVDGVCLLRMTKCDQLYKGACVVYNAEDYRFMHHTVLLVIGCLLLCGFSFTVYKARGKKNWSPAVSFKEDTLNRGRFHECTDDASSMIL